MRHTRKACGEFRYERANAPRLAHGMWSAPICRMSIKKIVVATDFSETADRAVDYALDFANQIGGDVTIVHAYEIPPMGFPDGALIATADLTDKVTKSAQAALETVVQRGKVRCQSVRGMLRDGEPAKEICDVAEELDADLVVVGTHGRRGLAHVLLGSVAEEVVRRCEAPVLTIRASAHSAAA
jgi:nucleotide-binding universal stress UspA family protein